MCVYHLLTENVFVIALGMNQPPVDICMLLFVHYEDYHHHQYQDIIAIYRPLRSGYKAPRDCRGRQLGDCLRHLDSGSATKT
jgi:hypothetical protein